MSVRESYKYNGGFGGSILVYLSEITLKLVILVRTEISFLSKRRYIT